MNMAERVNPRALMSLEVVREGNLYERFEAPHFRYDFECLAPKDRQAVIQLRQAIDDEEARGWDSNSFWLRRLRRELAHQGHEIAWRDSFVNLVVTAGKNDILTHEFAASAYTAAWSMGLVDGASAPTFAAADTMASHAGWTENQAYSQAARPTLAFAAASGGSIALSAAAQFSMNAAYTIAGGFFTTVSTKGGTTGTLYSAGAFTGGNKAGGSGDTINISASQAC